MKDSVWRKFKEGKIIVNCIKEYLDQHFFLECVENELIKWGDDKNLSSNHTRWDNGNNTFLVQLRIWALEHGEETLYLSNNNHKKWCIYYDYIDNELETDYLLVSQYSQLPYFSSEDLALQAIDIFGEELKELVLSTY